MASDKDTQQEREWQLLHDRITDTLNEFGRKDAFGKGDYWLVDDNWGPRVQQLEFQSLSLLEPSVIAALQNLLADHPNWEITVRIDVLGTEKTWPGMGLIIRHDVIIDELQRQYFPEKFRQFHYKGAKTRPNITNEDYAASRLSCETEISDN